MGIYGNKFKPVESLDTDLTGLNETNIVKAVTNFADLLKQWQQAAKNFAEKKWVYRFIKDDKQKAMLQKHYDKLTSDDISYGEYKKEFRFFCSFFGLSPNDIVIENILFQPATRTQPERIAIRYGQGRYKVKIPDDIYLIHTSPVDNIKALVPTFRSKTKGQYFYSSKRVFFTVLKPVNQFRAGTKGQKVTKYTPIEHIDYAYIDPTYIHFNDNCVFVETDKPIPVTGAKEKINKELETKEKEENVKEAFEYNEDEVLTETSLQDFLDMIKNWKTQNQDHSIKKFKTELEDEEVDQVKAWINGMKDAENYKDYKKNFDAFCKFCHIVPDGTIITKYDLNNKTLDVEYSYNTKKIKLPEDLALYHMSKTEGIKNLIPQFKGKAAKGYLYDKPRVYFTINKFMPKFLADYKINEKMHKYRCKDNIKDVYVDPLVWNQFQGAVYVTTNKEIPVEEIKPGLIEDKPEEKKVLNQNENFAEYMANMGFEIIDESGIFAALVGIGTHVFLPLALLYGAIFLLVAIGDKTKKISAATFKTDLNENPKAKNLVVKSIKEMQKYVLGELPNNTKKYFSNESINGFLSVDKDGNIAKNMSDNTLHCVISEFNIKEILENTTDMSIDEIMNDLYGEDWKNDPDTMLELSKSEEIFEEYFEKIDNIYDSIKTINNKLAQSPFSVKFNCGHEFNPDFEGADCNLELVIKLPTSSISSLSEKDIEYIEKVCNIRINDEE